MCRRVNCSTCGKPTFAGCGAHIEQVLGDVPKDKRCTCRESAQASNASASTSSATSANSGDSWFKKIFPTK